jgi:uncharacterized membrane-anchored protein
MSKWFKALKRRQSPRQRARSNRPMSAKAATPIELRRWAAFCCASAAGANLGDFLPDNLRIALPAAFAIAAIAAAALAGAQILVARRSEPLFWLAATAVRAAAILMADVATDLARVGYAAASTVLSALLVANVVLMDGPFRGAKSDAGVQTNANPLYWSGLLIAGALGTVIADGLARAFGSVKIGVPVAAAGESLLLVAALVIATRLRPPSWGYWLTFVVIGAWGTSVGDIAKFLLSAPVSLSAFLALLAAIVLIWRPARATREAAD